MMPRRLAVRATVAAAAVGALVLLPAGAASAHPLGNFTINHYSGLVLSPDRIDDTAVIDAAEIPTIEEQDQVDANADGTVSDAEASAYSQQQCRTYASQLGISVNGRSLAWSVTSSSYTYRLGAAGLQISRLECALTTKVDLSSASKVAFEDTYLADRIGWREITARGEGIALTDPQVPTTSISDELRSYPNALLSSPLDQRTVGLDAAPGVSTSSGVAPTVEEPGWMTRTIGKLSDSLDGLVGRRDLTIQIGLLAVALALVLGASHAALPGHGKTLMAAYMVGSRGTPKDAVLIGTTVTLAHTTGVLVLGVLFSASATFAGEHVLAVLGVVSGLMVAAIGVTLIRNAVRGRHLDASRDHSHDHGHGHEHGHEHGDHGDHGEQADHSHQAAQGFRRMTLVGMGLAGGLVPSPSALIVLLGAIALGRTAFGVLLVLAYGIGMAGTLTTVGYLVARAPRGFGRLRGLTSRPLVAGMTTAAPFLTAALVLVVGLGLAARSATGVV